MDERVQKFIQERDILLLSGDVNACAAFMVRNGAPLPSSFEVAEMSMHKAITGATTLPMAYRVKSYRWLKERGLKSFDDGDVQLAAEGDT